MERGGISTEPEAFEVIFEITAGEWKWQIAGTVPFRANGSQMELAIPRAFLGDDAEPLDFEFKWSDNVQKEGDVMEFYHAGDAAPSGSASGPSGRSPFSYGCLGWSPRPMWPKAFFKARSTGS